MQRVGIGYDIHKLVEGKKLMLGGVEIPFEKGLLGHSDGDALLHAIADAMLGAMAHGDIGQHFPDTDPKFKNYDSAKILESVSKMVAEMGYRILNVDANVILQKPKLATHIRKMRERVAGILGVELGHVSLKARSNEELDSVGRGEAIAVQVVVLLISNSGAA
jgi:2-C-methyl-D-erythritol 2,4-cyclodiphosphate synthase